MTPLEFMIAVALGGLGVSAMAYLMVQGLWWYFTRAR